MLRFSYCSVFPLGHSESSKPGWNLSKGLRHYGYDYTNKLSRFKAKVQALVFSCPYCSNANTSPDIVLTCDKWQCLSQIPRVSSGASTGPRLLPTDNMDKFTLWRRAWALTLFSLPIETQMTCWRRPNSKMTDWWNSQQDFYGNSLDQTLFLHLQPSTQ